LNVFGLQDSRVISCLELIILEEVLRCMQPCYPGSLLSTVERNQAVIYAKLSAGDTVTQRTAASRADVTPLPFHEIPYAKIRLCRSWLLNYSHTMQLFSLGQQDVRLLVWISRIVTTAYRTHTSTTKDLT